ncbi:hypothetical protein JVT61DRAFT_8626 [Boletus reticuloceps]|uniref:Uncharacterized protein n=1 Tax=Boletus reticuloceps TaxID=495285 RepID=A0A8I2YYJ6_9AGAM|nr:hypothetical protein JVT61DRAFT_8626 [Boletus reticuloceps]
MSSEPSAKYYIYSTSDGEPNAGIWLLFREQQRQQQQELNGQPVRIDADLVEWVITPPIDGSGWHCLGPDPYKHTTDLGGQVFATNDTVADSKWFLRPTDEENTYM